MVQGLRLCTPNEGGLGLTPGKGTRSHMLQLKKKNPECHNQDQSNKYLKKQTKNAAAAAKSLQSCPTLWDPIDSSPPGSPVPGILQARTLEWVAIS